MCNTKFIRPLSYDFKSGFTVWHEARYMFVNIHLIRALGYKVNMTRFYGAAWNTFHIYYTYMICICISYIYRVNIYITWHSQYAIIEVIDVFINMHLTLRYLHEVSAILWGPYEAIVTSCALIWASRRNMTLTSKSISSHETHYGVHYWYQPSIEY